MTNEKCGEFWPPVEYLTENMVCAGGEKSGCQGDSGKDPQCALQWCAIAFLHLLCNRVGLRLRNGHHIYNMYYLCTYKQFKVGFIKIQHS